MTKLLNKIFFHIKNIILPCLLIAVIYIILSMFDRLGKQAFGANFLEFAQILFPFILLITLWILNLVLKHEKIINNTFYNFTSLLVVVVLAFFIYRAIMDENMIFWHRYGYKINFHYFSDQIAPIKVMLYGLSIADILLIINNYIKIDNNLNNYNNIKS